MPGEHRLRVSEVLTPAPSLLPLTPYLFFSTSYSTPTPTRRNTDSTLVWCLDENYSVLISLYSRNLKVERKLKIHLACLMPSPQKFACGLTFVLVYVSVL